MKKYLTLAGIIFLSLLANAHGEDKPGPHGGHIKMPANFHTELVPEIDGSFRIYLIDLQFQNPSVQNSAVKVSLVSNKKKSSLNCFTMNDHFHCKGAKPFKKGTLIITATRNGTLATMDAKYSLPLKAFELSNFCFA